MTHFRARRAAAVSLALAVSLWVPACAAPRAEPDQEDVSCDASAECAPITTQGGCSLVRLCIAGRCEAVDDAGVAASSVVACPSDAR